jgi:glutamate synthase domain-containing protein 1/glutamate synthase domain-containing protein 3
MMMQKQNLIENILSSRKNLVRSAPGASLEMHSEAAEGGCGVVGLAANFPVQGIHLVPAATQMHNRGNGKGGGIAAAGLDPDEMGVSKQTLRDATLLQIAYIDENSRPTVESEIIEQRYEVINASRVPTVDDYRSIPNLDVRPPDVWRYFVRARADQLTQFADKKDLEGLKPRQLEDEFVYQTSFELNNRFYASLGEKQAFVLSHGRDLMVFKIVGYAEQAAAYYKLNDCHAHVWIAHQRYPTKGRVWHPGGAHPFIGLNEALVHNGDFANYHATCTYLQQRNIVPLFLTDTEVSALLFDLWDRVYQYPLEVIIEALAPTTDRDFIQLPSEKQELYRAIQQTHIHASPDGPWFFIIARSQPDDGMHQLLGITDTSMLRPQVFALSETETAEGKYQIGLVASEKQAIDATLTSLHTAYPTIPTVADRYWNARGGSHTDGGAFAFTVERNNGQVRLSATDKFNQPVTLPRDQGQGPSGRIALGDYPQILRTLLSTDLLNSKDLNSTWEMIKPGLAEWNFDNLQSFLYELAGRVKQGQADFLPALNLLTRLRDWPYDPGQKRKAALLAELDEAINSLLNIASSLADARLSGISWETRQNLQKPQKADQILILNVTDFPAEGEQGPGRFIVEAANLGWRRMITYGWRGQRFCGCGLGPNSDGIHIEVYGSSGDYLASGLDGAEMVVHGDAQDQVGQILNAGKLVVHGNVGQTFMYGAKGGEAYVLGNAAGRPLINAVGTPRVVINGTCLDYLAESFMAGDPLNGGGFVILNGISIDNHGRIHDLEEPYPGGNLFSLASGGAIYIRDPQHKVEENQLNGGHFTPLTDPDWALIQPYLEENARLFDIPIEDLLMVDGKLAAPNQVYRKVSAVKLSVLT